MSGIMVEATGGNTVRNLSDWLADAVAIEGFGAKGDGTTDDSAALTAALASGRPVRFGPKTYIINGPFTISSNAVLLGVRGETTVRRASQTTGSAWFTIGSSTSITLVAQGIFFDANTSITSFNHPSILVTNHCISSYWSQCSFANNQSGSGSGLVISSVSTTGNLTKHVVIDCEAFNNKGSGIYGQAFDGFQVQSCRCYQNGVCGIQSDFVDTTKAVQGRYSQIVGNRCWSNFVGITVGDFTQQNQAPGPANPDMILSLIQGNTCYGNGEYGIVAQGQYLLTCDNVCSGNVNGILANSSNSVIRNNMVVNSTTFGIDAGGSASVDISNNYVSGATYGIDIGGSQNSRVSGNVLNNISQWAIEIYNIETNAQGVPFPTPTSNIAVVNNDITIPTKSSFGGILVKDGAQGVVIEGNRFTQTGDGENGYQAILMATDQYYVSNNLWNGQRYLPIPYAPGPNSGLQTVLFSDVCDGIIVDSSSSPIQSIKSINSGDYSPYVTFVKVTNGGSGYTTAPTVVFAGGGGSGATATAYVYGGSVIGIAMDTLGSGYTSPPAVSFTSTGGGSGATATAFVGLQPPQNRILRIICNSAITFADAGSNPPQVNWTGSPITVQAGMDIEWRYNNNQWVAMRF